MGSEMCIRDRQNILTYLSEHRGDRFVFSGCRTLGDYVELESERSVDGYIQWKRGMGAARVYGGPLEIVLFHRMTGAWVDVWGLQDGVYFRMDHVPQSRAGVARVGTRSLHLLYNGRSHSDVLRAAEATATQ